MPHEQATTRASAWTILNLLMKFGSENWQFYQQQNQRIASPGKLLGAYWCYNGNRLSGGQLKTTRHTYLDLLNNLKFDKSDPIIGSNKEELSCIFALINGDNVEFNLRFDHVLHKLVRDWPLDSTAPIS